MKLTAFRIQNYRSIVDTTWRNLSSDNITGLIGQNESGKSSILEALLSFSTGEIIEDILRSDSSLPTVSCAFELDEGILNSITLELDIPPAIIDFLKKNTTMELTRRWKSLTESDVTISRGELKELYNDHEKAIEEGRASALKLKEEILKEHGLLLTESEKVNNIENGDDLTIAKTEKITKKLQDISLKIEAITKWDAAEQALKEISKELELSSGKLVEAKSKLGSAITPEEKKAIQSEISTARKNNGKHQLSFENATEEAKDGLKIFLEVSKGGELNPAIEKIARGKEARKTFGSIDKLTAYFQGKLPVFELFRDYSSLLPNSIDTQDIVDGNSSVEGYSGVKNFLRVAKLGADMFKGISDRIIRQKIENLNDDLTVEFQEFWTQRVGKHNKIKIEFELRNHPETLKEKAGKEFLTFYIKDGREKLYPKQRSAGVRWFLSFYLQLKAIHTEESPNGRVLLIDEPGGCLHAKAQEDVLRIFNDISNRIQIIYTTHSPYLLKVENIHHLLAVQRDTEDEKSDTKVLTSHELGAASSDTLSPLYTIMGVSFAHQQVIMKKNNVLLEEVSAFYYLRAFFKLCDSTQEVFFLPATGCSNIPQLANLFLGWGIDFIVALDDEPKAREVYKKLKADLFGNDEKEAIKKLLKLKPGPGIEDVFTRTDFKKFVLKDETVDIKTTNSDYMKNFSKGVTALTFFLSVKNGNVAFNDLNKGTRDDILFIVDKITSLLNPVS